MVLNRPIPPPSSVGLRPPRSLDRVVMRALQRDPDARYQTAEEMLIDLRRVAITEDLLAPASEVARWVTDTFGPQLELRRQAAGISAKPGSGTASKDSREISVPELGLGASSSATHALVHTGSDTHADDLESRTVMLHTGTDVAAAVPSEETLTRRQRNIVLGLAASMAGVALALAFMRPGWLLGGFLDEDGTYFEPDAPVILPTVVDAGEKPEDDEPETKREAASDGKSEADDRAPTDPVEASAGDAKDDAPPSEADAIEPSAEDEGKVDAPPRDDAAIEPGAAEATSDAKAIADAPPRQPTETAPKPQPASDPRRPTPAKPERPKPKTAKEPEAEPSTPAPAPPTPPPVAEPTPEPKPEPAPKAPAEEPSLPKPPDLKELLDGAP